MTSASLTASPTVGSAGRAVHRTPSRTRLLQKYLSASGSRERSARRNAAGKRDWLPLSSQTIPAADVLVAPQLARRQVLSAAAAGAVATLLPPSAQAESLCPLPAQQAQLPDYTGPGPFGVQYLPRLEHTCTTCFPQCVGDKCNLRIDITYPKGAGAAGLGPPYPLAIFTSGFLLSADSYKSYADNLASWGYTVVRYDKLDNVTDTLDDITSVAMLRELIDWCGSNALMRRLADASQVFLAGHSRGGKISVLAAAADPRVAAVCLLDPVDNTVYAPLAPGYPSAVAALQQVPHGRLLPVALVGAGVPSDCAPAEANFRRFYSACPTAAWEVVIQDAGHFQFLDSQSALQRAVCAQGDVDDGAVGQVSRAVMVAWAEVMMRDPGTDVLSTLQLSCEGLRGGAASVGPGRSHSPGDRAAGPLASSSAGGSSTSSGMSSTSTSMEKQQQNASKHAQPLVAGKVEASALMPLGAAAAAPAPAPGEAEGLGSRQQQLLDEMTGAAADGLGPLDAPVAWQNPHDMQRFLEHMLARLQYEQGLQISSRFKNFA